MEEKDRLRYIFDNNEPGAITNKKLAEYLKELGKEEKNIRNRKAK